MATIKALMAVRRQLAGTLDWLNRWTLLKKLGGCSTGHSTTDRGAKIRAAPRRPLTSAANRTCRRLGYIKEVVQLTSGGMACPTAHTRPAGIAPSWSLRSADARTLRPAGTWLGPKGVGKCRRFAL